MSNKYRILVVEDEPDHQAALAMILSQEDDFDVVTAGDTGEAEKIITGDKVDVVLMDIALPGESGVDFCMRLKEQGGDGNPPIIALSAYPEAIWKERVLAAGCVGFLSKPSDPKKIIEAIRKVLPA
jgi:CheY-like chemotaxis protein